MPSTASEPRYKLVRPKRQPDLPHWCCHCTQQIARAETGRHYGRSRYGHHAECCSPGCAVLYGIDNGGLMPDTL